MHLDVHCALFYYRINHAPARIQKHPTWTITLSPSEFAKVERAEWAESISSHSESADVVSDPSTILNPSFHTPAIPLVSLHRLRLDQCSLSPSGLNEDTGISVYSFFWKKCQTNPQAHLAATKLQSSWIIFVLKHLQKRLQVLAAPKQADVFSKFFLTKYYYCIYIIYYCIMCPREKTAAIVVACSSVCQTCLIGSAHLLCRTFHRHHYVGFQIVCQS